MKWFWYFVSYSFLGFLLEVLFARLTGGRADRKGLLLLPLCPVYGLGACAVLVLAPLAGGSAVLRFLLGALAATAVEYGMAVFYEKALGVSFWDYSGLPGSVQGRVCLPFSLAWGLLSLGLAGWVHPALARWVSAIPGPVTLAMLSLVLSDLLVSAVMMKRTGSRACLQWYKR